ncbi:MAG: GGDEF domain-containing protein [Treponemataceae bacterium]|nr:GGDEF domain-containing protein [Treponemataceae bacterium]
MTQTPFSNHYNHLKYRMAVGFSLAFFVVISFLSASILYQTNLMLSNKVLDLTSLLDRQVTVALNSVIQDTEQRMNILFLPTGNEPPEMVFNGRFTALQSTGEFAVVYQDGTVRGHIDEKSAAVLGKPLYSVLNGYLPEGKTDRTWITADDLSTGQVYYIRRHSPQSIIITTMNVGLLGKMISNASLSSGIVLRVIANNGLILYSSNQEEIGTTVDSGEISLLNGRVDQPKIVNRQLYVINRSSNGWLIAATADTRNILSERNELIQYVLIICFIAMSFIVIFCIVFSMNLTMPIDTLVRRLYNQSIRDQDTKLFLKEHFGECVRQMLEEGENEKFALIQLDIDNFKQMHDMRGNTFCNRIIKELADAMQATFPENALLGRIGNDRFMVFAQLPGDSFQQIHNWCLAIQDSFRERVEKTENATGISVSSGVVLVPEHGTDFDLICELSDRAVFAIKREGKNGYHIYTVDDDVNVWK